MDTAARMSELVETRWPHTLKQRIAAWGQGPWNDEADELEFEAHGFTCRLVRNAHMGCWCGYVALPNTHWAYGKEYSIIDDQLRRMCEDAPW